MVTTMSGEAAYRTSVSNGRARTEADTIKEGRGGDRGFRPHELLEAALASCLNMTVRMAAERRGLPPPAVRTVVSLDRSVEGRATFRYRVGLSGPLSAADRAALLGAVEAECSVGRTLRMALALEEDGALPWGEGGEP